MKLKSFAILLALTFAAIPSHAQSIETGDNLRNACSYMDNIQAAADLAMASMQAGQCVGFIEGTVQSMMLFAAMNHTTLTIPTTMTNAQAVAIVRKYLADHPERWNHSAVMLVKQAFEQAFPQSKQ